jgi:CDP-2,3-bis-(O-geranylgeranyl)-sn-glycerol synthase
MVLRQHFAWSLDFGTHIKDGTRVLGDHKTWRGTLAGTVACGCVAALLGYSFFTGAVFGIVSLGADASASFAKRRLRFTPGTEIPGLDQIPEALVPLLLLSRSLEIGVLGALLVTATFLVLDLAVMRMRHL